MEKYSREGVIPFSLERVVWIKPTWRNTKIHAAINELSRHSGEVTFYLSALPKHQWQKFPSSTPETNETHFWFQLFFHLTCWTQAGLNGQNLIILLVFSRNFVVETNLMPLIRDIWYCFIKVRKLSSGHPLQNGSSFSQKNLDEDAMLLSYDG